MNRQSFMKLCKILERFLKSLKSCEILKKSENSPKSFNQVIADFDVSPELEAQWKGKAWGLWLGVSEWVWYCLWLCVCMILGPLFPCLKCVCPPFSLAKKTLAWLFLNPARVPHKFWSVNFKGDQGRPGCRVSGSSEIQVGYILFFLKKALKNAKIL